MSLSREQAHQRWSSACHTGYRIGCERTDYLVSLIQSFYIERNARILEIGCNIGRNLEGLRKRGYKHLHGVEINPNTESLRKSLYPSLSHRGHFVYLPLETYLQRENEPFDLVYTMAVFEHIHPDSEWVFSDIHKLVKPGGYLLLIEDETNDIGLDFVFPRSYENLPGLQSMIQENCGFVPGLENSNQLRIFRRA